MLESSSVQRRAKETARSPALGTEGSHALLKKNLISARTQGAADVAPMAQCPQASAAREVLPTVQARPGTALVWLLHFSITAA